MQIMQFSTNNFISRLIKFRTWGPKSHTAFRLNDDDVIEAWHTPLPTGAVRATPLIERLSYLDEGEYIDFFDIIEDFDEYIAETFIRDQIGKPYDYSAIYNFISRKEYNNHDRWFCSELVFATIARAGLLLLNAPMHKVSPSLIEWSPFLKWSHRVRLEQNELKWMPER